MSHDIRTPLNGIFARAVEVGVEWDYEKRRVQVKFRLHSSFSVSWGNRTLNCPLGGGRYIHLTKETIYISDKYNISCVFMQIILYLYLSVLM